MIFYLLVCLLAVVVVRLFLFLSALVSCMGGQRTSPWVSLTEAENRDTQTQTQVKWYRLETLSHDYKLLGS